MDDAIADTLAGVGTRLAGLRSERGMTLGEVAAGTGISVSTLSRLESGGRRPTLELLLPLAAAYQVPLDELVAAPPVGDPRVRLRARTVHGTTVVPLTERPGGLQAFKMVVPWRGDDPSPQVHEGYEWLYVLDGRLRLVLGEHDIVLGAGEAAEFDTHVPHWFGAADRNRPVEVLSLFGPQGEKIHTRAAPRSRRSGAPD
ncbi:helix-turn-helix domain-containing protein [Pseudonocardia sp. HH130630-07]|uniref:helix-turn-helix domain-containing protein n=1 Tax=Pseudonocardia sp. HH130630-07 TaxID=1690815 RepID=UPI000814C5D1|nr:XRE family transcriptional regulator [Pseudonocardia sp. HH130630-07]ANY09125.1 XRE family transcriptional regulator [Pseudonocardia sp. HH130630-07]